MIKTIQGIVAWLLEGFRGLAPFMICIIGSLFTQIDIGMAGMIIAALAFGFALDMAADKAAARAEIATATKLVDALISGTDTQINVDINHHYGDRKQEAAE